MKLPRKTTFAAIGAAIIATTVLTGPAALAADENLPGWTFQEDVDLSDASRWTLETGQSSNTSSYDVPDNVSFDASGLTVRGAEETKSSASYTSGDAKGLGIEIPNYSRVEAVGSVPFGPGLWPALMWLRPLDSAHGEIDLMEVFGDDARVAATLHNEYGSTHRSKQGSVYWNQLPNSNPTATHTYVMEKTPNRIVISVDGHVMLDAGPEDMRPGFDWNAIFERAEATWYPRVTLQIGCAPADPNCGIGLPNAGWSGGDVRLETLKIWKMAAPGEQVPAEEAPVEETPVVEAPVEEAPLEEVPAEEVPIEETPSVIENGSFALQQGRELRYTSALAAAATSNAGVTFHVPGDLGKGVLYGSVQVRSSDNGRSGYRTTVAMKPNGSLALTLELMENGRRTLLGQQTVASRGSFGPGDEIRLDISYVDGVAQARAWPTDSTTPAEWQLSADTTSTIADDDGVQVFSYLSRNAPNRVTADWSDLHSGS